MNNRENSFKKRLLKIESELTEGFRKVTQHSCDGVWLLTSAVRMSGCRSMLLRRRVPVVRVVASVIVIAGRSEVSPVILFEGTGIVHDEDYKLPRLCATWALHCRLG